MLPFSLPACFDLRISQIAVHSTRGGIDIIDVFENSVIEHSIFYTINYGSHITLRYMDVKHKHYYHKLTIQDCIFTSVGGGSIYAVLGMSFIPIQIDISNITTLGQQKHDVQLLVSWENKAPYMVRIRDSLFENNGNGSESDINSLSFGANQKIQISNCTLAGHRNGITISVHSQRKYSRSVVTYAAPEIEIKRTIIRNNNLAVADKRGVGLKVFCGDSIYSQPSIMLTNVRFSSNINRRLSTVLPSVVYMEFAQNVSFTDCSFTGNRGTPIVAYSSHFNVSGTLNFVNNTGYEGGALAFYDDSFMSVHNHTEILFASNYAQRVGGAIYAKSCSKYVGFYGTSPCFFQLPNI